MDLDRFKEINDTLGHHSATCCCSERRPRGCRRRSRERTPSRASAATSSASCSRDARPRESPRGRRAHPRGRSRAVRRCDGLPLDVDAQRSASRSTPTTARRRRHAAAARRRRDVPRQGQRTPVRRLRRRARRVRRRAGSRCVGELRRAIDEDELVAPLPAEGRPRRRRASTASRRSCAGSTRSAGCCRRTSSSRSPSSTGLIRPAHAVRARDGAAPVPRVARRAASTSRVAVNLSAPNLLDLALPGRGRGAARHAGGVPPSALELEITESTIMADPIRVARRCCGRLQRARASTLAIDDFGTGYSSLAYLKRLPVDELKIDKSFVLGHVRRRRTTRAIVRSTIDLARNLGLRVVAEGVETERDLDGAARPRLRRRAGLPHQPAAPGRRADGLARPAQGVHRAGRQAGRPRHGAGRAPDLRRACRSAGRGAARRNRARAVARGKDRRPPRRGMTAGTGGGVGGWPRTLVATRRGPLQYGRGGAAEGRAGALRGRGRPPGWAGPVPARGES